MIITAPSWLPGLEQDPSTLGTVADFVLRGPLASDPDTGIDEPIFISAPDKRTLSRRQAREQIEALAAGLAAELNWDPNQSVGDRVVAVLSENTVDYLTYCWAVHRLRGTCLLLHPTSTSAENAEHIQKSGCSTVFVSPALFPSASASLAAIPQASVRTILTTPSPEQNGTTNGATNGIGQNANGGHHPSTLSDLAARGKQSGPVAALSSSVEEAHSSIAFLCPTSGTSGVQKLARITHRSIITNILQVNAAQSLARQRDREVVLCVTPLSHVQGVLAAHGSAFIRDTLILHAQFDMKAVLASVSGFKINRLYLIPAVLAGLLANPFLFKIFDLSSIESVYVGAGSLSPELHAKAKAAQPKWDLVTGYGLTEASMVVSMTSPLETIPGSSGTLMPLYQARLEREDGTTVDAFDERGELVVSAPNIASGYVGDDEANNRTFRDGWLYTGDIAIFKQSPQGDSHIFIVDRLRDMIKVKGMQISPVAIEDCLRLHEGVLDAAVIAITDKTGAGERPKAFIVPLKPPGGPEDVQKLFKELEGLVQQHLTEPHWIRDKYSLIETMPRNTSGKVAKGVLRAKEAAA